MERTTEYIVQPELYAERNANYDLAKTITSKWSKPTKKSVQESGASGTLVHSINYDRKTSQFIYREYKSGDERYVSAFEVMSSALLLYRLICIFPSNPQLIVDGAQGYKVPWEFWIKHKETNTLFCMSEWKGGISIRTEYNEYDDNAQATNDIIDLLNLIVSNESPHPYDGCTAGQVA